MRALALAGVGKRYGRVHAVRALDLDGLASLEIGRASCRERV